jgi:hypothetical protein
MEITVEQMEITTEMPTKKKASRQSTKKRTMGTSKPRVARLSRPPRLKKRKK